MEPADSPFSRHLRRSTRRLTRGAAGAEPDEALRKAVVEDFNRMLSDPHFGRDFIDGSAIRPEVAFTQPERDFAEYLLVVLREEGAFDERATSTQGKVIRIAQRFNKLLFLQRFRKFLDTAALFTPGLTPDIRTDFERAGFRLDKEHLDLMPFEDVLVFRPDRNAGAGRGPEWRK